MNLSSHLPAPGPVHPLSVVNPLVSGLPSAATTLVDGDGRARMTPRRRRALWFAAALAGAGAVVASAAPASAHGAMMVPGSRTYLCWKDGLTATGQIVPKNPACAAAVAQSGPNSLYN